MTQTVQAAAFKTEYDKLFIGGAWVTPSTSEVIEVHSPATGEKVGQVPLAAAADVDAACAAARKAFDEGPWPTMTPQQRAEIVWRRGQPDERAGRRAEVPAHRRDRRSPPRSST